MARIYWLQGFVEHASALADESVEQALDARHSTGVCFALAMGGCAVKLWNGEFRMAERIVPLMQDHSRVADSMYWQNYVEVFLSGFHPWRSSMTRVLEENMVSARKGFETLGKTSVSCGQDMRRQQCWAVPSGSLLVVCSGNLTTGGEAHPYRRRSASEEGLGIAASFVTGDCDGARWPTLEIANSDLAGRIALRRSRPSGGRHSTESGSE